MGSSFSVNDWEAIGWYCEKNKLVPELTVWPNVRLSDKNGRITEHPMWVIRREWENQRGEDE